MHDVIKKHYPERMEKRFRKTRVKPKLHQAQVTCPCLVRLKNEIPS